MNWVLLISLSVDFVKWIVVVLFNVQKSLTLLFEGLIFNLWSCLLTGCVFCIGKRSMIYWTIGKLMEWGLHIWKFLLGAQGIVVVPFEKIVPLFLRVLVQANIIVLSM